MTGVRRGLIGPEVSKTWQELVCSPCGAPSHLMGFTSNWSDTRQSSKNGFVPCLATVHAHGIVVTDGKPA